MADKHSRYRGSKKLQSVELVFHTLPIEHRRPSVLFALAKVAGVPQPVVEERTRLALAYFGADKS